MPVHLRHAAAALLLAACAVAGEVPRDGLELRGAAAFPEEQVRRAIAGDLPLLLAGRQGQATDGWRRELERAVILGYRAHGFRAVTAVAEAVGDGTRLSLAEGVRSVCGPVRLQVPPGLEEVVRRAVCEATPEAGSWDIDTGPQPEAAAWPSGAPVDWNAGTRYADRVRAALRGEGMLVEALAAEVLDAAGTASLELRIADAPVTVRLGRVRIAGLPSDEAERLRAWLGLAPDVVAGTGVIDAVLARLSGSASFLEATAGWEDQDLAIPPALIASLPMTEFEGVLAQDAAHLRARVRDRGRADLLVTVRRVPGAPLPWEEGARERAAILAARARMLARFAAGADLVVDADAPAGPVRAVWSAAHGIAAMHTPGGGRRLLLALGDGWLACDGPAGRLRAPMLAPRITAVMGPDHTDGGNPFNFSLQIAGVSRQPRLQMNVAPAAFVDLLLRPRAEHPPQRAWEGDVLVLDYAGSGVARIDPAQGVALQLRREDGAAPVRIALEDGAWARDVAPVISGAVQPPSRPVGSLLAEVLAAVRVAYPQVDGDGFGRAMLLLRSGSLDALIDLLGGLPAASGGPDRFSIPVTAERRPQLPVMQFMIAAIAADFDGLLGERLSAGAWPRVLLRATAMTMAGDLRSAAAALKPAMAGEGAGPIGCLAIAHAARLVGQDVLAGLLAEAGAARCDADGLADEARILAGLAPALLPAVAASADLLAVTETDVARAGRLRALAAACSGPAPAAVRLETAARLAATLGACDWLRARCAGFGAGDPGKPLF